MSEGNGQDVEADDTVEVPEISCSDTPSGGNSGRRDKPVVRPDVLADGGEFGPDSGVRTSGEQTEGQRGKRGKDCLDEGLTAASVLRGGTMYAMQQLRGRDGGDTDLLVRPHLFFQSLAHLSHGASRRQAPDGAFEVDEDAGI